MTEYDLVKHIERQQKFSLNTFGPGDRAKRVVDHIRKELIEVEADPKDLEEWIDIILLALDGAWRSGASSVEIAEKLEYKLTKNEHREWPDWRTMSEDKAIQHVKSSIEHVQV